MMADIGERFAIDEDRVVLTGISQGGFGTFRLGELYPDKFCALIPLVGQSALLPEIEMMISGGEPFMPDALENLCNAPGADDQRSPGPVEERRSPATSPISTRSRCASSATTSATGRCCGAATRSCPS